MPEEAQATTVAPAGHAVEGTVQAAATMLATPGLVIVSGPAGRGRTHVLSKVAAAFRGPVFTGGGLAMLRGTPGLALTRAVTAKLPAHDIPLCAEAVRSRVRGGLLVIDDLQWCDPATLAVVPMVARHCRVIAALRTPHRLPAALVDALIDDAHMLTLAPLSDADAAALVAKNAPGLADSAVATLVGRGGGNPLVLTSLAAYAQRHPDRPITDPDAATPAAVHVIAESIADLPRAARTVLAAIGLLGRPASTALLGDGVDALAETGLVTVSDGTVTVTSPYTAEIAAGLLDSDARAALHRRLASLVDDMEAARHLAAAGDHDEAYTRALAASGDANRARRAEALLFAVSLPGDHADHVTRLDAAAAALAVGRPRSALSVLAGDESIAARVLTAEAHLHAAHLDAAAETAAALPSGLDLTDPMTAAVDRVRLLAIGDDATYEEIVSRHGAAPESSGIAAAVAAHSASRREPGWTQSLAAAAAAAGRDGDVLSARWSAWLLVEYLMADGDLANAAAAAAAAARACTADHAYSWQTRFLAAQVWCQVLRGDRVDDASARAVTLLDHALPSVARGYASATASLAEADAGALRNARHRLRRAGPVPPSVATVLRWVAGEAAWLDNQPSGVDVSVAAHGSLVGGLGRITANWAAVDAGENPQWDDSEAELPQVARATLTAWRNAVSGMTGAEFAEAANAWRDVVLREQVRCLLAHGAYAEDASSAVPPLAEAERIADEAGLLVLAGRARQALRRHRVRRDQRGRRAGDDLTEREREVLRMVADGEPTRRIAGALGIARETVETHIRAGMRKLGAKTRTEAAVRAAELFSEGGTD